MHSSTISNLPFCFLKAITVETKIIDSIKKKRHLLLQTRLHHAEFLTKKNSHLVLKQLRDVIEKNKKLHHNERMSLDFLGGKGYVSYISSLFLKDAHPHFSNLLIVHEGKKHKIRLVDTELLRLSPPVFSRRSYTIYLLSLISWWINKLVFKLDFRMEI